MKSTNESTDGDAPVRAAGFLIARVRSAEIEVLLMRHADRWDLPKGHADPDETTRQTALRELFEETGLRPEQIRIDERFEFLISYPVPRRDGSGRMAPKEVRIGLAWLIDPAAEIRPSEHGGFRWFVWSQALRIQAQTIDPLLDRLAEHWSRLPPGLNVPNL